MNERPTFSPFWSRVRALKCRLRPQVQVARRRYRGRAWHVAHDPATNQFFRMSPVAHEFVALLDGRRSVEDAWRIVLERRGDDAPTQQEVIQLLSQLYGSNLLSSDAGPEAEQLLGRGRKRLKQKVIQQAMGVMYFKIRLLNPDRLFTLIEPLFRPIVSRLGLAVWLAVVGFALLKLLPEWRALVSGVGQALSPSNWPWLAAVFVVTKLWHETGHGVICKSLGLREAGRRAPNESRDPQESGVGQVPEFGVMMLVLFPAPYVDASSAWALPGRWQRVAVGAGGMLFELFVAALAVFVWLETAPGLLVNQIAYNVIFTAGVSTILFNANPLMRFDGYYILSDLMEVPNLMGRSTQQLKHWFLTRVYRVEEARPPSGSRSETSILYVYGVLAMVYRVFLFFSIALFVMGKMFAIGLLLAVWTGAMWFITPIGKLVHWLATGPNIAEKRGRAIAATVAMFAVGLGALGLVPVPDRRRASGVIEAVDKSPLFVGEDGFVTGAPRLPGERVAAGDALLVLESPELEGRIALTRADLDGAVSRERQETARDPAAAEGARERVASLRERLSRLLDRRERLIVRAPHDGVFVGSDLSHTIGSFARRGEKIGEVVEDRAVRIAAVLTQREAAWHFDVGPERYTVSARLVRDPSVTYGGRGVTVVEAGQTELPHAALGFAGGGQIETDPDRPTRTKDAAFVMRIAEILPPGDEGAGRDHAHAFAPGLPGERVSLRFTLPARPVLVQFVDRMHKLVQGRVKL